jgi:hypothetical protein
VQRATTEAVRQMGHSIRVTCHSFRAPFAPHLPED